MPLNVDRLKAYSQSNTLTIDVVELYKTMLKDKKIKFENPLSSPFKPSHSSI
jgi:hypothetical protein